jgi:transposase
MKSNLSDRRIFTREFKTKAVNEVNAGTPASVVARRCEINVNLLYRWRQELAKNPITAFCGVGNKLATESREAELERKIGQMTMENDLLKKLLRTFEEQRAVANGSRSSTKKSAKQATR